VHLVAGRNEFVRLTSDLARNSSQTAAVYFPVKVEPVGPEYLGTAAQWIGSILTKKLTAAYGDPTDIYAALFVHLRRRRNIRTASAVHVPRGRISCRCLSTT
jgi:hypothetical protein